MKLYIYKCKKCGGKVETDVRVDLRKKKCRWCKKATLEIAEEWGEIE